MKALSAFLFSILALLAFAVQSAGAAPQPAAPAAPDPTMEFLHALQQSEYGDVALEYLKSLKDKPGAPPSLKEVYDVEMAQCIRSAARWARNEDEYKQMIKEAQGLIATFIQKHPDHPAGLQALAAQADDTAGEALKNLVQAKELQGAARTDLLAKARKGLTEARTGFLGSAKNCRARLDALPPLREQPRDREAAKKWQTAWEKRMDLTLEWYYTRMKAAVMSYHLAEAENPDKPPAAAMATAGKEFDKIYQETRSNPVLIEMSVPAHFWHGKTVHMQGNLDDAMDIYDEVMASAPDTAASVGPPAPAGRGARGRPAPKEKEAAAAVNPNDPLLETYADCQRHRWMIVKQKRPNEYYREARAWLPANRALMGKTNGYQGILLDLGRFLIKNGKEAEGKKYLAEAAQHSGPLRDIAIALLGGKPIEKKEAPKGEDAELTKAIDEGNACLEKKEWQAALEKFEPVLDKIKDKERLAQIREAVAGCCFMLAREHFEQNEVKEGWTLADKIIKNYADTPAGPPAAAMMAMAAFNQYAGRLEDADPQRKAKAKEQALRTARFLAETWPKKPERDYGLLLTGRVYLFSNEIDEAMGAFRQIKPDSDHRATAMYFAANTYWRQYRVAKAQQAEMLKQEGEVVKQEIEALKQEAQVLKQEAEEKAAAPDKLDKEALRRKAVAFREEAVALRRKAVALQGQAAALRENGLAVRKKAVGVVALAIDAMRKAGSADKEKESALAAQLLEAQALYGEMLVEGGQFAEALKELEPLLERIKTKPADYERSGAQVYVAAIRALLGLDQQERERDKNTKSDYLEKARKAGLVLLEIGPDHPVNNGALIDLSGRLAEVRDYTRLLQEATVSGAETEILQNRFLTLQESLTTLLTKLCDRKELSPLAMLWIARRCSAVELDKLAMKACKTFEDRVKSDPEFAKSVDERVKLSLYDAQLTIGLKSGQFGPAQDAAKRLSEKYPKALEPKITLGKILVAWAAKDSAKFPDAVNHVERLRRTLEAMVERENEERKKAGLPDPATKKPEDRSEDDTKFDDRRKPFFEITYLEAECFFNEAKKLEDRTLRLQRAKTGEQLLQALLIMSPKINGKPQLNGDPEMLRKYEVLLEKLGDLQGRKPAKPKPAANKG